ncbi:hypothetical protein PCA31118_01541 [Pandoraea captiosa]|uniref:Uncharacterized protein n=2 Tax=Pandoraea captiosa TaxID=2508302 RepID=A0A5E4ZTY0_9BURK|nr:hypothetical protein PCA31118_01541 [Pandoraea captiosa]
MLVANFVTPSSAAVPQRFRDPDDPARPTVPGDVVARDAISPMPDGVDAAVPALETSAASGVMIEPVRHAALKSQYAPVDVLRALAAARTPFSSTGESISDAYTLVTGREVPATVRKTVKGWTAAIDMTTGFLPEVQLLRLPAEISDVAVERIDGKTPSTDQLIGLVQFASPRGVGAPATSRAARPRAGAPRNAPALIPSKRETPWQIPKDERAGIVSAPDNLSTHERSASRFAIKGEFDHLDGYEQRFTEAELPSDKASRLVVVGGNRYLRGEAGYYRATQGISADHWLIDAPRHARAQVPVTYDHATGQWQAHEPLRLCGGGCGSSRPLTPDSIAGSFEDIFSATRHLPDESAQEAIQNAFADLSRLHLVRSNRPDLRTMRDNSIVDHRASLRTAMKGIDRRLPLIKQQCQAAEVTARYYYSHPFTEAFCQENAEILFFFLLQDGIDIDNLRMITVQPKNRSPHVMVLYSESTRLIDILDASTPHPRVSLHQDGISSAQFAWAAYMTRDTTLLLDPWSRSKAVSFARADTPQDAVDILDVAFTDIGHRIGSPYTVSITRPLTARKGLLSSHSSFGSVGSAASSGAISGSSGSSATSGAAGTSLLSASTSVSSAAFELGLDARRPSAAGAAGKPRTAPQTPQTPETPDMPETQEAPVKAESPQYAANDV